MLRVARSAWKLVNLGFALPLRVGVLLIAVLLLRTDQESHSWSDSIYNVVVCGEGGVLVGGGLCGHRFSF